MVIKLSKPFAPLTAALADRAGMVLSPAAVAKLGDELLHRAGLRRPVQVRQPGRAELDQGGQGPAVLRRRQGAPGRDRVPDHHRLQHPLGQPEAPVTSQVADSLSTQDVADAAEGAAADRAAVAVARLPGPDLQRRQRERRRQPAQARSTAPIAKDPRVRQALRARRSTAPAWSRSIFNDLNTVACSPISPKSEFTSDAVQKCPPHDPAKAKQLLAEAGVKTPYKVTMITSNNPDSLRLAQALQSMVKDGGFDLMIKPVEYASLLDQQDRGDFELLQLGLVRPGRPRREHHQLRRHRRQPERRRLQQPRRRQAADRGPSRPPTSAQREQAVRRRSSPSCSQDDPLIYLYRQRNLTGVVQEGPGRPGLPGRRDPGRLRRLREVSDVRRYLLNRAWQSARDAAAGDDRGVPRRPGAARRPGPRARR